MSGDCSLRETISADCPECGAEVTVDAWVVVDGDHRAELLGRAAVGRLNLVECSSCGSTLAFETPLVIWRRESVPPLLFLPSSHGAAAAAREGLPLIERLAERARALGSRLNTNRAVLTSRDALWRALTGTNGEPDDPAYRYYLKQVDAWIRAEETDRDLELLDTVYTWGDLARVIGERPGIAGAATMDELDALPAASRTRPRPMG